MPVPLAAREPERAVFDDEPVPEPPAEASASDDPCPACGQRGARVLFRATDRLYHTTGKEFQVVECAACKLIRLFPWPDPSELRNYYPDTYWFVPEQDAVSRLEEMYRRLVLRDHIRFVASALERAGEKGPVLDVGCGGGLFLHMLAERGWPVMGLDFSLGAAAVAWRVNGVPAICGTLSRAPLPPGSCAGITMFHVIEHLYDPVTYLEAARELLQPEGRLIVQVPNASCWQSLLFGESWSGYDVPRHLINYRARDLEILLDRCGFDVVRTKFFSLRDNPAGLATSLAPSLDPMARRGRELPESSRQKLLKDLAYLALVIAAVPFTVFEAACRSGSTVMIEARKRS